MGGAADFEVQSLRIKVQSWMRSGRPASPGKHGVFKISKIKKGLSVKAQAATWKRAFPSNTDHIYRLCEGMQEESWTSPSKPFPGRFRLAH